MANNFITFPERRVETEYAIERSQLGENWKIPIVFSVLDGTHITIAAYQIRKIKSITSIENNDIA